MADSYSNIDELLEMLNNPEDILSNNSNIEDIVGFNGGKIIYKYQNILIACEINENLYSELLKNPDIEYIEALPLKRYGGVDDGNINYNINPLYTGTTTVSTTIVDGVPGNTNDSDVTNITISGNTVRTGKGIPPIIENTILTISATTNSIFSYDIIATGTLPIRFEVIKPTNYNGELYINGVSTVMGKSTKRGIYTLEIKAINAYGSYTKNLTITLSEPVKITNTQLLLNNRLGSNLSYSIESSGSLPKIYAISGEPSGVSLDGNLIGGIPLNIGTYNIVMTVSGSTTSDSKMLILNVGTPPIITSVGNISGYVNSYFEYIITPSTTGVSYSISGNLNDGLSFKTTFVDGVPIAKIDGIPTTIGSRSVIIKALNAFGESSKTLIITVNEMI